MRANVKRVATTATIELTYEEMVMLRALLKRAHKGGLDYGQCSKGFNTNNRFLSELHEFLSKETQEAVRINSCLNCMNNN